jgi:ribose 1,5-bisphosphate isomerase
MAAETYKFSPYTLAGEAVEIEERDPREILDPPIEGIEIRNPTFDATPPEYIDAIITEIDLISPEMAILVITEFLGHRIVSEAPKGYEDSKTELRSPY